MNYYKILENNVIVGAITSNDFMRYLPIADCFMRTTEQYGEYATYKGNFYRATWMQPIVKEVRYVQALIIAISEEEYNAYIEAFETQEVIEQDEEEPEVISEEQESYVNPIDTASIEFIRETKLLEMNNTCHRTIESGFDLDLRGETHHFSLTTQDQLNLMSLGAMVDTQSLIPYHADGEECIFFTPEEIKEIIAAAASFKNYQLSYHNSLKTYINTLDTIEAIAAITYGTPIPDEYKSDVLKVLE